MDYSTAIGIFNFWLPTFSNPSFLFSLILQPDFDS